MTDRDALLKTIRESPGDDAPRLVYADWLRENGDPRLADLIAEAMRMPRRESEVLELVNSPGPNAMAYMVRPSREGLEGDWDVARSTAEPLRVVADLLRAIPFDYLPGYELTGLECQRQDPDGSIWNVKVQYRRPA